MASGVNRESLSDPVSRSLWYQAVVFFFAQPSNSGGGRRRGDRTCVCDRIHLKLTGKGEKTEAITIPGKGEAYR